MLCRSVVQPKIKHTSKKGEGVASRGRKGKNKETTRVQKPAANVKSGKRGGGGRRPQTPSTSSHSDESNRSLGGRLEVAQNSSENGVILVEHGQSKKTSRVEGSERKRRRRREEGVTTSSGHEEGEEEEKGGMRRKRERRDKKIRVADTSVAKWKPVSMVARKLLSDGMISALGYVQYTTVATAVGMYCTLQSVSG